MSTLLGANLKYVVGIIAVVGLGVLAWWIRPYVIAQLSVFSFIVLEYAAAILALSALKFRIRPNFRYIAGIVVLTGLGVLVSWIQQYIFQQMVGATQISAFLYIMIGYGAVILALSRLRVRIGGNVKYLAGIIVLTGFGALTWYAQEYVAPALGVFFGFIVAYAAVVLAVFYILGRYGG